MTDDFDPRTAAPAEDDSADEDAKALDEKLLGEDFEAA